MHAFSDYCFHFSQLQHPCSWANRFCFKEWKALPNVSVQLFGKTKSLIPRRGSNTEYTINWKRPYGPHQLVVFILFENWKHISGLVTKGVEAGARLEIVAEKAIVRPLHLYLILSFLPFPDGFRFLVGPGKDRKAGKGIFTQSALVYAASSWCNCVIMYSCDK